MIDDLDGPQFCDDYGFCICGNDCFDPEPVGDEYYMDPVLSVLRGES
jgi:hypothetical protein